MTPSGPEDKALAERYLQGFIEEIGQLGHSADVAHTILGHDGALTSVHFTVAAAFEQTPGPAAGQPLKTTAALKWRSTSTRSAPAWRAPFPP